MAVTLRDRLAALDEGRRARIAAETDRLMNESRARRKRRTDPEAADPR